MKPFVGAACGRRAARAPLLGRGLLLPQRSSSRNAAPPPPQAAPNAKRQGLRSVSEQIGNGRAPSPNEASALPPRAKRQPPHSLPGGSGSGHARSPSEAAAPAAPSPSKATAVAAPSPREAAAAADPKFGQHLPPRSGYLRPISAGLGRKQRVKTCAHPPHLG